MRSLIRKEWGQIFAVVAPAFVLLCLLLLDSRRGSTTLIVPDNYLAQSVFTIAAISGAVLGYLQFASERWMGKTAYLLHRGTRRSTAFAAKAIAGLGATLLLSLGPLVVLALSCRFLTDNGPLVRFDRVVEPACAAAFAATAYGLGVLAAQVRRHPITEIALATVGVLGAVWLATCVLDLAPTRVTGALAVFVISQLGLGAILLALARRLFLDDADREITIRRAPLGALALVAVPMLVLPAIPVAASLQGHFLVRSRASDATLLRDDADGSIFAVRPDRRGDYWRLDARGEVDRSAPDLRPSGQELSYETLYPSPGGLRSRGTEFPEANWETVRDNYLRYVMPGGSMGESITRIPEEFTVFFDRTHHVFRVYGLVERWGAGPWRQVPVEFELGKPPSGTPFSDDTRIVRGLARPRPPMDLTQALNGHAPAADHMHSCIVDPEDGSLWTLDLKVSPPVFVRNSLPGGDRFVRFEPLYERRPGVPGRQWTHGIDFAVRGERGAYAWDGDAFRDYEPTETLALDADVASRIGARAVATATDPLATRVEIQSTADERVLFTWDYGPRNVLERLYASLAQGLTLLRPPLANAIASAQPSASKPVALWQASWFLDPLLVGGRRSALLAASVLLGLASALWTLRRLRQQHTALPALVLWSVVVLLIGPIAALVARMFEARRPPEPAAETEPAFSAELLIESR